MHRLEDRLLCARSYKDLIGRCIEVVLGAKFLRDRILKFRDAGSRRVMGLSAADRLESRFRDVFWRVKVRLAETHGYHVIPLSLKFGCEFCYRKRCGFLYKAQPSGRHDINRFLIELNSTEERSSMKSYYPISI